MAVSQKPSPLWNVPYRRNEFFIERDDALHVLHQELQIRDAVALSQPQAITGLGGIGKTQMALEYAYCYGSQYAAVLWVRADSSSELVSSFVELAYMLNLPESNEQDQNIIVEAVQHWLRHHTDWLLILDNMDDPFVAEPFLPNNGSGHLLITTRAQALNNIAQCIEVQQMKPEIGALLLLRRAKIISLQATLEHASKEEQAVACDISRELGGLPLALDQAGAYVNATSCSLQDYLTLYRTRHQNLLQERGNFDQVYPNSVATTWSLSFEKVQKTRPAAAELLNFCAFLSPDAIPEEMITRGSAYFSYPLQSVTTDPLQLNAVIAALLTYSLISRHADNVTLSIHRLVQVMRKDAMDEETQRRWSEQAVRVVSEVLPPSGFETWPQYERYLTHAQACALYIEQEAMVFPEATRLLSRTGWYLLQRSRYIESEPLLRCALASYERQLGAEHLSTAASKNDLAVFLTEQGKYTEAEVLMKQALSIRDQILGHNHLTVAQSLSNLARLYSLQGMYAEVEPLLLQALAIYEQQLESKHPFVAYGLNNLAEYYKGRGKYEKAEPLIQRALIIWKEQLRSEHPDTALGLESLAEMCIYQGKHAEAESLYQKVLAIREQELGANHPHTATSLNGLAELYRVQGKFTEAEPLYKRALEIREQKLGSEHSDTQITKKNYVALLRRMDRDEEARKQEREI